MWFHFSKWLRAVVLVWRQQNPYKRHQHFSSFRIVARPMFFFPSLTEDRIPSCDPLMLSTPTARHREVGLSLRSTKRPEPNRALRVRQDINEPADKALKQKETKTPSVAPLPPSPTKNRLTRVQWESAQRKLVQFMKATMFQPLPVDAARRFASLNFRASTPSSAASPEYMESDYDLHYVSKQMHGHLPPDDPSEGADRQSAFDRALYGLSHAPPSSSPPSSSHTPREHSRTRSCSASSCPHDSTIVDESPQFLLGRFCLPSELLTKIIGLADTPQELMTLSRVCKSLRTLALAETTWQPILRRVASECNIEEMLIRRNASTPSYLLCHAILRWRDVYLEMRQLLDSFEPPQVRDCVDARIRFDALFETMMPGVTPWESSNYIDEEVVLRLPSTVNVLPSKDVKAIIVFIELERGPYKHELEHRGLAPSLQFCIYEPTGEHPVITLTSPNVWHPLLNSSTNQLCLPIHRHTYTEGYQPSSAESVREVVLLVQEAFTSVKTIASDFTL